ncbi:uncharacterized protein [Palaemon carinicauda]|uniref:uncharacterized protein n=1 Tax=Palaemon carinicauda TaxID=392227 RepID=UPI0035B6769C
MKCLRSVAGVSQLDRVRNKVEKVRMGIKHNSAARVDIIVLRLFGHVERMKNGGLLKTVMDERVDGRNTRGRARFGWMDGMKKAVDDRRIDVKEEKEHVRNSNKR